MGGGREREREKGGSGVKWWFDVVYLRYTHKNYGVVQL